jgi:hypothetical protein
VGKKRTKTGSARKSSYDGYASCSQSSAPLRRSCSAATRSPITGNQEQRRGDGSTSTDGIGPDSAASWGSRLAVGRCVLAGQRWASRCLLVILFSFLPSLFPRQFSPFFSFLFYTTRTSRRSRCTTCTGYEYYNHPYDTENSKASGIVAKWSTCTLAIFYTIFLICFFEKLGLVLLLYIILL